ncbi:MAG: porin [bacterium]|nr:porin [bacterium]
MKRVLIVLAVFIMITGSAMAGDCTDEGADCGMSTYGKIHLSIESMSDSENSGLFLASNSSRFGIKGWRTICDGRLSLIWQIESSIVVDKGSGTWAARNTFGGLKGSFGSIKFGRIDSPILSVGRKVDYFGDRAGDSRQTYNRVGSSLDTRYDDMILYSTPDMSGFTASLAMSMPDEIAEDSYYKIGGSGIYKAEAFLLGGGIQMYPAGLSNPEDPDAAESETALRLVGKYWLEKFSVGGLFQTVSNDQGVADVSAQVMGFGGQFRMSDKLIVKGQYYILDPNKDVDDDGATLMAFSLDHGMGSGTTMYLIVAMMTNADNAAFGLNGCGHGENIADGVYEEGAWVSGVPMGETARSIGIGLIHSF